MTVAHVVPKPCGVPPAAAQPAVSVSRQVPSVRQQACWSQLNVRQVVPGPAGVPPCVVQSGGSRSRQPPTSPQQASLVGGGQVVPAQVVPGP